MGDLKVDSKDKDAKKYYKLSVQIKYLALTLFVFILIVLFSGGFGLFDLMEGGSFQKNVCGDGTLSDSCSSTKPYFCFEGKLVDSASVCGCSSGFFKKEDSCFSIYQTEPKKISLNYTLRGKNYSINFTVYRGLADYISNVPRSIRYTYGDDSSRADFKLKAINEEEQRKLLLPLVIGIQNITPDKEDQVRIAISIVQNIPFGASIKTTSFGDYKVNYSRYPYEVLYEMQGICGEKTDLLAFLLSKLGYGTSFFYYPLYNHEALGIKCPVKESIMGSGYCFVETTGPSIITDNKIYYTGLGKIYESPEVYPLSNGLSLGNNLYEYSDANRLIKIREAIKRDGQINIFREIIYENLKEKYGLVEYYYSG